MHRVSRYTNAQVLDAISDVTLLALQFDQYNKSIRGQYAQRLSILYFLKSTDQLANLLVIHRIWSVHKELNCALEWQLSRLHALHNYHPLSNLFQYIYSPRLPYLTDSTPSCFNLRYKWVRSKPVFSATRVILPPSRCK